MLSSSNVPASAGEMPGGGSYIGATEMPGSGSRPLYHHKLNITTSVTSGKKTMGLPPRNQKKRVMGPGGVRMPLGMYTSMVNPPRIGKGLLVSNCAVAFSTVAVASRSADP